MRCTTCDIALPPDARFCAQCGRQVALGERAVASSSTWLVVILVVIVVLWVVFVAGVIAAIAIPNFLNAVDRGKQKRSMADLRTIGTAIEEYGVDHDHYPAASDFAELVPSLVPVYAPTLPEADGWGHRFLVFSEPESYEIASPGKDGVEDGCGGGVTEQFSADICFAEGEFNQWPDGRQQ